jgi:hypothetical protein
LIAIVSKNATALVAYERQKKELGTIANKMKELTEIKSQHEQVSNQHQKLIKDHSTLSSQLKSIEARNLENLHKIIHDRDGLSERLEN